MFWIEKYCYNLGFYHLRFYSFEYTLKVLIDISLLSHFCILFGGGELVLHVFKKAAESVLGETVIFLLTVPDVERSFDDALADAG